MPASQFNALAEIRKKIHSGHAGRRLKKPPCKPLLVLSKTGENG